MFFSITNVKAVNELVNELMVNELRGRELRGRELETG